MKLQLAPDLGIFLCFSTAGRAPRVSLIKRIWSRLFGWWMAFARVLGHVNTILLLTIMYVLIIGPSWVVLRLLRKDPLRRKAKETGSFWIEKEPLRHSLEETRHQF
jgi:hypothetical protein